MLFASVKPATTRLRVLAVGDPAPFLTSPTYRTQRLPPCGSAVRPTLVSQPARRAELLSALSRGGTAGPGGQGKGRGRCGASSRAAVPRAAGERRCVAAAHAPPEPPLPAAAAPRPPAAAASELN